MKKTASRLFVWLGVIPLFTSCNIYKPFATPSNDEEYRQAALSCLQDNNYTCAVDYYNKLSDTGERDQNLCTVEMAQAGMTLIALVNVVSDKSTGVKLFGALANQLMPYNVAKGTAATDAKAKCAMLPTTGPRAKLNTLLLTLSYLVDCSVRMAKTETLVCTLASDGGQQNGAGNATIKTSDISTQANGTLSAGNPGMCDSDANACGQDVFNALNTLGTLRSSGFDQVANNINAISTIFGTGSPVLGAASRVALLQTVAN